MAASTAPEGRQQVAHGAIRGTGSGPGLYKPRRGDRSPGNCLCRRSAAGEALTT